MRGEGEGEGEGDRGEFGIFLFVRFIIYMHVLFRGKKWGNGFGLSWLRAGFSVVKH